MRKKKDEVVVPVWKKVLFKEIPSVGIFILALLGAFVMVLFLLSASSGDRQLFKVLISTPVYDKLSSYDAMTDARVIEISDLCSGFRDYDQVSCVLGQIHYNYSDRENPTDTKTLSEMENSSGLCRDIAVAEGSVFKNLDYQVFYRFVPNHIYLSLYKYYDDGTVFYCDIDALDYNCREGFVDTPLPNDGGVR